MSDDIKKGDVRLSPCGPSWRLDPGRRYRLSGWIKTENVRGEGAFLSATQLVYSMAHPRAMVSTAPLLGTHDWTHVSVDVEAITDTIPHVWMELRLYGAGKAWFDDVALMEI